MTEKFKKVMLKLTFYRINYQTPAPKYQPLLHVNSGDIKNETEFLPLIIIYMILKTDSKKYDS